MDSSAGIFSRTELLVGADGMEKLSLAKVIIFGVGGVGSWCAESLIRSGIVHLTIVDSDVVAPSNINRQLMATTESVGVYKVNVLSQRLQQINPAADIVVCQDVYSTDTADKYDLSQYDYVVDAIDSMKDKALLILNATASGTMFVSSMGAALKMDSSRVETAEFWKVEGCRLAASLRRWFKTNGKFPSKKFICVYSGERLENMGRAEPSEQDLAHGKRQANGTIMYITAIFGLKLSELIIKHILVGTFK